MDASLVSVTNARVTFVLSDLNDPRPMLSVLN
jgi:hypothetical protein